MTSLVTKRESPREEDRTRERERDRQTETGRESRVIAANKLILRQRQGGREVIAFLAEFRVSERRIDSVTSSLSGSHFILFVSFPL